ncbi:MAG: AAA family ATPase [Calditrichaceae bacterium]|nr:AAA family ATPase [Calditrichaceae bacterium]MBN2708210.1 AAA family ATPase [Calditrichaceae bacterium]RQV92234.1 MAG: AAA family ATPase [Calditrichota bacterium]
MTNFVKNISIHSKKFPTEEQYPFNIPLFRETSHIHFDYPITFFVGENGSGKSTLLEAIARACGIYIWKNENCTRYITNNFENIFYRYISIEWSNGKVPGSFFGSDIFRDFARYLDSWAASDPGQLQYFGGESLITKSHGQSLMSFFRNRYKIEGIYFLDEPETALSPNSQLELLDILATNSNKGHAQFIIATHSPILLACKNAQIYNFDQTIVTPIMYTETMHYKIYRDFLSSFD